jgi:hypothetical protein
MKHWLILVIIGQALSACQGLPTPSQIQFTAGWTRHDLVWIDAPDDTAPAEDIAAVYFRSRYPQWQLRLDLLDIDLTEFPDLYLAIDHQSGGNSKLTNGAPVDLEWDTLIYIPANGNILATQSDGLPARDTTLQVERSLQLDAYVIAWGMPNASNPGSDFKFVICTSTPGQVEPSDCTPTLRTGQKVSETAKVLFAFTEIMPAYTPAQAMRRWDGAHTGPNGGRHGLYNLLRTARNHQIPILLADVKALPSLEALDLLDGLQLIRNMQLEGLLIAPEFLHADPGSTPFSPYLSDADVTWGVFPNRLFSSQFRYYPFQDYKPGENRGVLFRKSHPILILPDKQGIEELAEDGLSVPIRRVLLAAANQAQAHTGDITILGGSLPESTWGEPASARAGFMYLRNHSWISVLTPMELLTWPASPSLPAITPNLPRNPSGTMFSQSKNPSMNAFSMAAFQRLYSPIWPNPPLLDKLRSHYRKYLEWIRQAEAWAAHPTEINTCAQGTNGNTAKLCIVASKTSLAVFDLQYGNLIYLFVLDEGELYQLIGPTFQFASGTSDPDSWEFNRGTLAEKSFSAGISTGQAQPLFVDTHELQIAFGYSDRIINYTLKLWGIYLAIDNLTPTSTNILLAFDSQRRYQTGGGARYRAALVKDTFIWTLDGYASLALRSNLPIVASSFLDTKGLFGKTEDPNQDYPQGHYLPIPLAEIHIGGQDYWVDISLNPR